MLKIKRKSLLYKSGVEYADYCINHVEGCSHGCKFPCYAMNMKKRCGVIKDYKDWIKPKIVENALVDEYLPIKINSLSTMLHFDSLPNSLLKKLIGLLSSSDSKLIDSCARVFKKFIINDNQLFEILSYKNNYMNMNKHSIRRLLIIYFKSIFDLENFRKLIINSNWDNVHKEMVLKELYTFEQILLKNL